MWYEFDQNNSGGSFNIDRVRGIGPRVWIEAIDYADANDRAEALGIYFDGCENGHDCDCCGDRWYRQWEEGEEAPSILENYAFNWHDEVYIHPMEGRFFAVSLENYNEVLSQYGTNQGHA